MMYLFLTTWTKKENSDLDSIRSHLVVLGHWCLPFIIHRNFHVLVLILSPKETRTQGLGGNLIILHLRK